MPERPLNEEQLRRSLRRRSLTFAQRRKHLERLDRAIAAEEAEMEFLKRRNRAEFGVLAAAVVLVFVGFLVWTAVVDESNQSDEGPDLVAAAEATLTARATPFEPAPIPTHLALAATLTPTTLEAGGTCAADPLIDGLPPGLPAGGPSHHSWYGNTEAGIWASPAEFGVFMPDGFRQSGSLWFAGEVMPVLWYGPSQSLVVTGEQLDGSATLGPIQSSDALSSTQHWTTVMFPEPGCWQLTGTSGSKSLTTTVNVLPVNQRADFQLIRALFDARPFEPPASCSVTPLAGPDAREPSNFAHFWLEAGGISADVAGWFIAGEQQSMGVYGDSVVDGLTATIRSLEPGILHEMEASTVILNSDGRVARFVFPEPGCWDLTFATAESRATFTVYVYPKECLPVPADGSFLVSCEVSQP